MPKRQPGRLAFQGFRVDGPEIIVIARHEAQIRGDHYQAHGPLLRCVIPASAFLDDDVCNAVAWAQQRDEIARGLALAILEAAEQDPLF